MIEIIIFFLGACFGSFANVVALRWNTGLSPWKGESKCLHCGHKLTFSELVPLFSYIYQSGRCTHCKSKLSLQYFLMEIFSGLAALYLYIRSGLSLESVILYSVFFILSIIFVYDLRHKIIPDLFVFIFFILSFFYSFSFIHYSLFTILYSSILVPLPFFLLWLISRGRYLGLGDVKLMAGIGALFGLIPGFSAVVLSFWAGAGFILIIYLFRFKKNLTMKSEIPFGPFLIIGAIIEFVLHINLFNI